MAKKNVAATLIPWSPPVSAGMDERWREKLLTTTGKSLDAWASLARKKGPGTRKERREWLMETHGLGRMFAWYVDAAAERDGEAWSPETLIARQFDGPRKALLPIMEAVVRTALALGDDVRACPCETMIPLYRTFVFAEVKVAAIDRIDLGLALGDAPSDGRLVKRSSRAAGNRITHTIALGSLADIDRTVKRHLAAAYTLGDEKRRRVSATPEAPPTDVAKSLRDSKSAGAMWKSLTDAMRNDWLRWITSAKKPETRAQRIVRLVERMEAGLKKIW